MWQDYVLTIVSIAFSYALIPQIILSHKTKEVNFSWQTIIITCICIYIYSFCNYTLSLYLAFVINFINASCWGILGIQKFFYRRSKITKN